MSIKDNIASIKQNIKDIEEKCHREDEVNLMAVTKTVDVDKVLEAIDAGIKGIKSVLNKELGQAFKPTSVVVTTILAVNVPSFFILFAII